VAVPAPAQVPVATPAPVITGDPFRAATPYNPTIVGRHVPNPQLNRPWLTIPCENPNQNFAPYEPTPPDWLNGLFGRCKGGCGGCGGAGCLKGKGGCAGGGCGGGSSCSTCQH
jgi:hypothetical protein